MAIIGAGLAGAGGLLGNLIIGAVGVGIKLALNYFFPQKIEGPRASDLRAQTARYGDPLARVYGASRGAGAVIWLKGDQVDEHVKTSRQGKGLGPEVTEYSYTATFAVGLAWNGPVSDVPRIWADNKLIYDQSADALGALISGGSGVVGAAEGATITIYLGTDDQEPDPDIEADRGAGLVPAWPGLVYVVIKDLPLDEFGIRVPNIEAEIIRDGDPVTLSVNPGLPAANPWSIDTRGDYYAGCHTASALVIGRLPNNTILSGSTDFPGSGLLITARGDVLVNDRDTDAVHVFDPATGIETGVVDGVLPNSTNFNPLMDDITIGGVSYALVWRQGLRLSVLTNSGDGWSLASSEATTFNPVTTVLTLSVGPDYAYAVRSGTSDVVRVAWRGGAPVEVAVTIPATSDVVAAHYDGPSDSVIVVDVAGKVVVLTADLGTVLRSATIAGLTPSAVPDPLLSRRMKTAADTIAIRDATTNDIYEVHISTLDLIRVIDASATDWDNKNNSAYRSVGFNRAWRVALVTGASGVAPPRLWFLPRVDRAGEPLADVIAAECGHAGLAVDVTQVTDEIRGYAVRSPTPPRGVLEDLCRVNFLDFAQIDGLLTFFPRKTAADRTLTIAETGLAFNAEPPAVQVVEEYPAAGDLPEQMILTYPAWSADYRQGAQAGNVEEDDLVADEPSAVDETGAAVRTRRHRSVEFSTSQVLTDDEAAKVIDKLHRDVRDAATLYRTALGPRQIDLNPGDVIDLPLDDDRTAKAVITRQAGETLLETELRKRGSTYASDAVGQPTPYVPVSLLGIANLAPVLIDGHLMRAADDDDGFYVGVTPVEGGQFRGGILYRSADGGSNYSPWAAFTGATIRGLAVAALPDRPHPHAIDRATEFVIAVPQGAAPDSVTEAELLASQTSNAFAVWNPTVSEWEYIRAASVVDNADGTWTLSTLLRGQKGTEGAMAGHVAGAAVHHVDAAALARTTEGDRTLSRTYVAVAVSTLFDASGAVTFTNQGKGLRPWAPVDLRVARDGAGNITGAFNRRDRLGQQWPESGAETPPMSEDSESYKVRVYDSGSPNTVLRTISVTSEGFSYSAADQTTDFGSPQSSIDFGVVQVSSIYGDGLELRQAA